MKYADTVTRTYILTSAGRKGREQMKIEIKLSEEVKEPYAVIHTNRITEEIRRAISMFEMPGKVITAKEEDRIVVLKPEELYMARVEKREVVLYCEKKKYSCQKKLYELEELLGEGFMRISKTTIVNLSQIAGVEPSFNAMMYLLLKNGCKDYITRTYLAQFKKYLGL